MKKKRLIKNIVRFIILITMNLHPGILLAEDDPVNIHGFVSQGYLKSNHNNYYANTEDGTFEFNEMGLYFTTDVTEKLHLGIQFFARDMGRLGNDDVRINWAYADYRFKDFFGIRAGKMKIPLGLYNEYRDMDILRPNIFYPNSMYNESWRDILASIKGIGMYGNLELGIAGKLKYLVQSGVPTVRTDEGATDLLEDRVPNYIPPLRGEINSVKVKQTYTYSFMIDTPFSIKGLKLKSSGAVSEYDNLTTLTSLPGEHIITLGVLFNAASLEYSRGNYTITSEYMHLNFDIRLEGWDLNTSMSEPEFTALAYYTSFSYLITDWFEIYLCYSNFYDDKDDRDGSKLEGIDHIYRRWYEEYILSMRFDLNTNWIFKIETHINNGTCILLNADQGSPVMLDSLGPLYPYKQHWVLFAAKLSYNF